MGKRGWPMKHDMSGRVMLVYGACKILALAWLCLAATVATAHAAGLREIQIPAGADGPAIDALMWTPCAAEPQGMEFDKPLKVVVPGVRDCPVVGQNLPLIVVSHGGGSAPIVHHDTAEALADAGFAVVALKHPNDRGGDLDDKAWLIERPTDVKRVLDYMLGSSPFASVFDARKIGFFGFSRGGYTGLMLAGAAVDPAFLSIWGKASQAVFHRDMSIPPPSPDRRFKVFVLADPLAAFFMQKSDLGAITAPMQIWSSQMGGAGVTPQDVATLAQKLPLRPEFHFVPNSQHASFGMVCTPDMEKAARDFCADPPGFDRASFHREFNAQVVAFFRKYLL